MRARKPERVVAVALANKLARIAWAMMSTGESFNRTVYQGLKKGPSRIGVSFSKRLASERRDERHGRHESPGHPDNRHDSQARRNDRDQGCRISSGPAVLCRTKGRTYDRSRPKRSDRRNPLAKRPSTYDDCVRTRHAPALPQPALGKRPTEAFWRQKTLWPPRSRIRNAIVFGGHAAAAAATIAAETSEAHEILDFPQYRLFKIGPLAEELDPIRLRAWDVVLVRLTSGPVLCEGPRLASLARIAIKHEEEGVHLQLSREIEADAVHLPVWRATARATKAQSSAIASELASCSLRRAS